MDLQEFDAAQREALLDLAVLAMYADRHLAAAEEERVGRLLTAMALTDEYDRSRALDDAISRVSRHTDHPERVIECARGLAKRFATVEQRRLVHHLLREVLASDGSITPQESQFLGAVREALGTA